MILSGNTILHRIIWKLDTATNKTNPPHQRRYLNIEGKDLQLWGVSWEEAKETAEALKKELDVEVKYADAGHQYIKRIGVWKDDFAKLQKLYGLTPSEDRLQERKTFLESHYYRCSCEWLKETYYKEQIASVERGTFRKNFDSDPVLHNLINYIATNKEPIYVRSLSVNLCNGNSHEFEQKYKSKVCSILKKCPDLADVNDDMSDNDILRYFNVLTYNNVFEFKGNLVYEVRGRHFDTTGMIYGNILNTSTLVNCKIKEVKAKRIITIENKANFYAEPYDSETLYIYVHGFLSPAERKLCEQIKEKFNGDIYHYGDLDFGGIRIYEYLRKKIFTNLKPYKMDVQTYEEYQSKSSGIWLDSKKADRLRKMHVSKEMESLKSAILMYHKTFEQEIDLL